MRCNNLYRGSECDELTHYILVVISWLVVINESIANHFCVEITLEQIYYFLPLIVYLIDTYICNLINYDQNLWLVPGRSI